MTSMTAPTRTCLAAPAIKRVELSISEPRHPILTQASLSFLGVGIDPRIPNWGGIINEGKNLVMIQPHQCGYAGLAIMITVLAFSIMGDGLRDILDPKLR